MVATVEKEHLVTSSIIVIIRVPSQCPCTSELSRDLIHPLFPFFVSRIFIYHGSAHRLIGHHCHVFFFDGHALILMVTEPTGAEGQTENQGVETCKGEQG